MRRGLLRSLVRPHIENILFSGIGDMASSAEFDSISAED
jgi:hypothetical protein